MPWIPRPFDYYGTASNQILEDLTQVNDNFEILGNCFVNNNPTTGIVKNADQVDGFHASQTPAANTIPVADANGKIADGWLSNIPYVRAKMSADQSLSAGVWTKIAFNTVAEGGNFDTANYRFVVPVSGLYVVMASICLWLSGSTTSTSKIIRIYINETTVINEACNDGVAGASANACTQAILSLNANDTISIYGYFGTGGSVIASKSWFQVFRLR
jgi:NADPH-dependent curcumin reductase CurA